MISVLMMGGLGNQMFQYAAAKSLACRHGVAVSLDVKAYRNDWRRSFMLDRLQVVEAATPHDGGAESIGSGHTAQLWRNRLDRVVQRFGGRRLPQLPSSYGEPHFQFDPAFFDQGTTVALFGYFQSERYFADIADQLREWFRPHAELGAQAQEVAGAITRSALPVSVHIRRGDYVSSASTIEVHGVLGPGYYRKALQLLQVSLGAPMTVFVFSDDAAAAEETLAFMPRDQLVHVRGDPDRPWEDLALMARCRHHIIANSSFSWWGAWLNPAQDKVVIAPRQWFTSAALRRYNTCDLYPEGWILV